MLLPRASERGLSHSPELRLGQKIWQINWGLVVLLTLIAAIGVTMLYSAANGSFTPWASRHIARFALGLAVLLVAALVDIRTWFRLAYPLYFAVFALLIAVEVMGTIGMGAQRWIDLKVIQLQPSELMKLALILAVARYFHGIPPEEIGRIRIVILPILMVLAPIGLVLKQPDLGTAGMLGMVAAVIFFCAGVRLWKFALVIGGGIAAVPIGWQFLHDYQRRRVLTFLNPENDPLGAGYHITQSKIALGSGGLTGKGFMEGTQSHLNFLPEKQTDFVFTMLAEEFGMIGGLALLGLYLLVLAYGFAIAFAARHQFGRLVAIGIASNLFFYVFINVAMVMGLIPVVGVPLPLISYGGTAMLAVMASLGVMISVHVHRDVRIARRGLGDD